MQIFDLIHFIAVAMKVEMHLRSIASIHSAFAVRQALQNQSNFSTQPSLAYRKHKWIQNKYYFIYNYSHQMIFSLLLLLLIEVIFFIAAAHLIHFLITLTFLYSSSLHLMSSLFWNIKTLYFAVELWILIKILSLSCIFWLKFYNDLRI